MAVAESYIISIGTAVPEYRYTQQSIASFMEQFNGLDELEARKVRRIYDHSGIGYRHSVLPDFSLNGKVPVLFDTTHSSPALSTRLHIFNQKAPALSLRSVQRCLEGMGPDDTSKITHLITVSCTGLAAPGLDVELLVKLKLPNDTVRTAVNFMGCYAGFHALRIADAACRANAGSVVLLVLTELCSLHFQSGKTAGNVVVNSLFADGSAAILVAGKSAFQNLKRPILGLCGFYGEVIHDGAGMMKWNPSEDGFLMGLDAQVPELVEEHTGTMVQHALQKFGMKRENIAHWALHPGGRKILDAAARSIGLDPERLKVSKEILNEFGNMSSPTVVFVLDRIWKSLRGPQEQQHIFAAGFGPGLTMEAASMLPVLP